MSYILDALKKADAERERRGVPDLHAETAATDLADEARSAAGVWRGVALGALGLLLAGALLWWWLGSPPAREETPLATAPPAPVAVSPSPAAAVPPTPMPAPAPAAASGSGPMQAPPTVIVPPAPAATAAVATAPASSGPAPTSAVADARVPTLDELAPELRRQLPALVVGGSVYSTSAASRMVIINNPVLREGDRVADGLTVERIGPKGTVLSMGGTRFELRH